MDTDSYRRPSLTDIIDSNNGNADTVIVNDYRGAIIDDNEEESYPEYTTAITDSGEQHVGEVTTIMDRVYEYINRNGTTSGKELSEKLGLTKHQIEHMIETLETTGLIKVKYSVFPNGNVDILVVDRDQRKPFIEKPHLDRIKILKGAIKSDMEKLEDSLLSIEQNLKLWSSETEEKVARGGVSEAELSRMNRDSMSIEKSLEKFREKTSQRVSSIKRTISGMRVNINSPITNSKPKNGGKKSIFKRFFSF